MRECRHFVPEVGREVSVILDSGEPDVYRRQFLTAFPVPETLRYLLGQEPPARFVDIGANIGGLTFFAAALGSQVLAVEALPENFVLLAEGARVNGFRNVIPCHLAASAGPGILHLAGHAAWAHVSRAERPGETTTVPALAGDEILDIHGFGAPDLIKIDVEGHELEVLTGLAKTLQVGRPVVILESNPWCYDQHGDYERPVALLRDHDYAVFMYLADDVKDDEDFRIQERCVADYYCIPREKIGRVPMPRRRSVSVEDRLAIMNHDLVGPLPHWWHAAHAIDRLEERFPDSEGLELLKGRIGDSPDALEFILRQPSPPPRWLESWPRAPRSAGSGPAESQKRQEEPLQGDLSAPGGPSDARTEPPAPLPARDYHVPVGSCAAPSSLVGHPEARSILRHVRSAVAVALDRRLEEERRQLLEVPPPPPAQPPCSGCAELGAYVDAIERSRGWRFLQVVRRALGRAW